MQDYAILNYEHAGYVFVPANKEVKCVLFRIQHCHDNPTHMLVHEKGKRSCALVCLRKLLCGEELTFDYCLHNENEVVSATDVSDMEQSFSLSSQSQSPVASHTTSRKRKSYRALQSKFRQLNGVDVAPELGFTCQRDVNRRNSV